MSGKRLQSQLFFFFFDCFAYFISCISHFLPDGGVNTFGFFFYFIFLCTASTLYSDKDTSL